MSATQKNYFAETALPVFDKGWTVLPATGKAVKLKGWSTLTVTRDRVAHWAGNGHASANLSCRTGHVAGYVAIDIDVTDKEVSRALYNSAKDTFGETALARVGRAPKILLVVGCKTELRKLQVSFDAPDDTTHKVEILADGQQFVAFGMHPDTKTEYYWVGLSPHGVRVDELPQVSAEAISKWITETVPALVPSTWKRHSGSTHTAAAPAADHDPFADYVPPTDESMQGVEAMLTNLDPDIEHDRWVQVGMALHHQFGGSDEAFHLFDNWSASGEKYKDQADTLARWRSFGDVASKGRKLITLRTVALWAKQAKQATEAAAATSTVVEAINKHRAAFLASTTVTELRTAAAAARGDLTLDAAARDTVRRALQTRFNALGEPISAEAARSLLGGSRNQELDRVRELAEAAPTWLSDWLWITASDQFFNITTGDRISKTSFNAKFDREVMNGADGANPVVSAAQLALNVWRVPTVSDARYNPLVAPGARYEMEGVEYVNSFRGSGVERKPQSQWDASDRAAVAVILNHFEKLVPDAFERSTLISWLAFCSQNPGEKINWAPLIRGTKGDGKTFIYGLMCNSLGKRNTKVISPEVLKGDFSGWGEGSCFVMLEEMKLHGHNRYDAANKLKPYITNPVVPIHRKGVDAYDTINTQNYFVLTNFDDAMPIDDDERRYFCLRSPFNKPGELISAGMDDDYFDTLFAAIDTNSAALAEWLLTYPIAESFRPKGRAPRTQFMEKIVSLSRNDDETAVLSILGAGERGKVEGVGGYVLSSKHLMDAVNRYDSSCKLHGRRLAVLLTNAGWSLVNRAFKWRGSVVAVWVRGGISHANNLKIRDLLDETCGGEFGGDDEDVLPSNVVQLPVAPRRAEPVEPAAPPAVSWDYLFS